MTHGDDQERGLKIGDRVENRSMLRLDSGGIVTTGARGRVADIFDDGQVLVAFDVGMHGGGNGNVLYKSHEMLLEGVDILGSPYDARTERLRAAAEQIRAQPGRDQEFEP